MSSISTMEPNRTLHHCVATNKSYHYIEMCIDSGSLAVQLFFVCAIITYRKKLAQNLVNVYAANVVFGNFALSFLSTIVAYMEYFGYTRDDGGYAKTPKSFRYFWLFVKTFKWVMLLVIWFGIGILILAVKNNVFRVHRAIAGMTRYSVQTLNTRDLMLSGKKKSIKYCSLLWVKKNPRCFAALQILTAWLIPILFFAFSFVNNQCISQCRCLINFIPRNRTLMRCSEYLGCNLLWPSFPNWEIITSCIFWFLCMVTVVALFARSYYNLRQLLHQRQIVHNAQLRNSVIEVQKSEGDSVILDGVGHQTNGEAVVDGLTKPNTTVVEVSPTLERSGNSQQHRKSKNLLSESIISNLSHNLLISIVYILGSGPILLFALYISFNSTIENYRKYGDLAIIPFIALPALAGLINSILLCWVHQGLSHAVRYFIRTIFTCRFIRKKL